MLIIMGLPWWLRGTESACWHRRRGFDPWVGKSPWRRKWQSTPVFLPEESRGRRSLVGYHLRGCRESDTTERLHLHLQEFCTLLKWGCLNFSAGFSEKSCVFWIQLWLSARPLGNTSLRWRASAAGWQRWGLVGLLRACAPASPHCFSGMMRSSCSWVI